VPKLTAFIQVTLDGYFADAHGDMSWAHKDRADTEWNAFVAGNANSGGRLLFGRVTYELMASYWPSQFAAQNDPVVARQMNALPKIVFSRTLDRAEWDNTLLVKDDLPTAVRQLKGEPGPDMAILGSGSIIAQLTAESLIDEFQIVVNPIVLGQGRALFEGVRHKFALRLTATRSFSNGSVLLCYQPAG
jgi:dihydrofolate reductase